MGEKESIIKKSTSYEGIFKVKDLINLAKDFGKDKGYGIEEGAHTETVNKDGRNINFEVFIKKTINDYIKLKTKIAFEFTKVNDKVVEKKKYQTGKVTVSTDAVMETDYEKRWESKPTFWLLKHLFEKYVYDSFLSGIKKEASSDVENVLKNIKAYLNMLA